MSDDQANIKGFANVLPYLWIGTADAAMEKQVLKSAGITHVLNCSSEDVDNFFPEDFTYKDFPIEDVHDAEPSQYFEPAYEFISEVKDSNKKVFVHCTTGKNISPVIVLAYMMMSAKKQDKILPLLKAYNFLNGKFIGIQPSDEFMRELLDLEERLFEQQSMRIKSARSSSKPTYARGKGKRGK